MPDRAGRGMVVGLNHEGDRPNQTKPNHALKDATWLTVQYWTQHFFSIIMEDFKREKIMSEIWWSYHFKKKQIQRHFLAVIAEGVDGFLKKYIYPYITGSAKTLQQQRGTVQTFRTGSTKFFFCAKFIKNEHSFVLQRFNFEFRSKKNKYF